MPDNSKTRILFVDDEKIICSMASDFLELNGYDVDTYEDSREALDAFSRDPDIFDIVVTDQTMPELTGLELIRKIIEIRKDIPRILCTGFSDQLNHVDKSEVGIDAFFMKPYRFDELIGQIDKLV